MPAAARVPRTTPTTRPFRQSWRPLSPKLSRTPVITNPPVGRRLATARSGQSPMFCPTARRRPRRFAGFGIRMRVDAGPRQIRRRASGDERIQNASWRTSPPGYVSIQRSAPLLSIFPRPKPNRPAGESEAAAGRGSIRPRTRAAAPEPDVDGWTVRPDNGADSIQLLIGGRRGPSPHPGHDKTPVRGRASAVKNVFRAVPEVEPLPLDLARAVELQKPEVGRPSAQAVAVAGRRSLRRRSERPRLRISR